MAENLRILVSETQRSVRTSHHVNGKKCAVDGGKKIKEKKEHIVVDTLGPPMATVIHLVNIHDSKGEVPVIKRFADRFSELKYSLLMVAIEAR